MIALFEILGFLLLGVALVNQLFYAMRLQMQTDRAIKYRFASAKETNALRTTLLLVSFAIFFFAFIGIGAFLGLGKTYQIAAAGFMAFLISFMIGSGLMAYVKYYYPFNLEKRLKRIRFKPMKSSSGGLMRLLNELEEDAYLTKEMIEKEENLEADFDVWFDDSNKQTVIMQYDITEDAFVCPNCNFRTLKEQKHEVVKEPTATTSGLMIKYFRCTYCGHREDKEIKIPSWQEKREAQQA